MDRLALLVSILSIFSLHPADADKRHSPRYLEAEARDWREFQEFREWRRLKNGLERGEGIPVDGYGPESAWAPRDPPPSDHPALMGRYIVNQANWSSVATISSRKDIASYPFVNVISVSDGPRGNGSGIPYMYLTPLDFTAQDLSRDHRSTMMMTLAQGLYCQKKLMDPMDPRCARIVLSGKIKRVSPEDRDYETAKSAVFGRHPWLANMPADHHFFFAKLKIGTIAILDAFGGPKYVSVKEYLNPTSTDVASSDVNSEENLSVYRV